MLASFSAHQPLPFGPIITLPVYPQYEKFKVPTRTKATKQYLTMPLTAVPSAQACCWLPVRRSFLQLSKSGYITATHMLIDFTPRAVEQYGPEKVLAIDVVHPSRVSVRGYKVPFIDDPSGGLRPVYSCPSGDLVGGLKIPCLALIAGVVTNKEAPRQCLIFRLSG